jgi:selenide,water dikinase
MNLLLAGAGLSHLQVLRSIALARERPYAVTLVSPYRSATYSGMLPGVVAGHYPPDAMQIPLAPLVDAAQASFIEARVAHLDLHARVATLDTGARVPFDVASLDVGTSAHATVPGVVAYAIPVRPIERFGARWSALAEEARAAHMTTLAMVGGGAAGIEMLLAMQHALLRTLGSLAPRWTLVTDTPSLLPQHARSVRRRLARLLVQRDVVLQLGDAVAAIDATGLVTASGARIAADRVFWSTGASAAPWLAASGLGCDERGFVLTDEHLRSTTHPFLFAAGDCASQRGRPRAKAGTFAVRQGPPLAENLVRFALRRPLVRFSPPRHGLALISTGGREAVLSFGPLLAEGAWVWRLKDRIDRAHVAKYRAAVREIAAGVEG